MNTIIKDRLEASINLMKSSPYNVQHIMIAIKIIKASYALKYDNNMNDKISTLLIDTFLSMSNNEIDNEIVNLLPVIISKCCKIHSIEELVEKLLKMEKTFPLIATIFKNYHVKLSDEIENTVFKLAVIKLASSKKNVASWIINKCQKKFDIDKKIILDSIIHIGNTNLNSANPENQAMQKLINNYIDDKETSLTILKSVKYSLYLSNQTILTLYKNIDDAELIITTLCEMNLNSYQLLNFCSSLSSFVQKTNMPKNLFPLIKILLDDKHHPGYPNSAFKYLVPILEKQHIDEFVNHIETTTITESHVLMLFSAKSLITDDLIPRVWQLLLKMESTNGLIIIDSLLPQIDPEILNSYFDKLPETKFNYFTGKLFVSIYKTQNKTRQLYEFHKLLDKLIENNDAYLHVVINDILALDKIEPIEIVIAPKIYDTSYDILASCDNLLSLFIN